MEIAKPASGRETFAAAAMLALVLHVCFFPFIWGNKTLLTSSRGLPSVMPNGAWYGSSQGPTINRGNDPGASAWVTEPDAALVRDLCVREKNLPLWNPYQSFGAPLAANMQSQPFNPLFVLYALGARPRTYNLFLLCRFLIAGLGAFLYLRLFAAFVPSLAGGVVSMLAGYYILFFNMPHLSVEVWLPALFFAIERLIREQSVRNVILTVLVVWLVIVGGMPESTFLALLFAYAYFVFRLVSDPKVRYAARRQTSYFVFVNLVGFALAAFLLIPFSEFLGVSFDAHQVKNVGHITGLDHDWFGLSICTYVVPMIFGTAWNPIGPGLGGYGALRNFFGILPLLLALVAGGSLVGKVSHRRTIAFFAVAVAVILLRRYGVPPLSWIGDLPFFRIIRMQKYEEPLAAFAFAALCGFGLDQIHTGSISRRRLTASLGLAFLLLAAIVGFSLPAVLIAKAEPHQYYLSLAGTAAILFSAALLLLGDAISRRWLGGALVLLLVCEMAGSYIFPVYYLMTHSATDGADPYRGAPYIAFLKSRITGHERVFGRDGILYPGWAGAFQLSDIRGLDAIYYWKYLRFARFFLRDEVQPTAGTDLTERFTGLNEHTFDTALKRRLLQLSSVRYLLSIRPFAVDSPLVREIFEQNAGRLAAGRENLIEMRQFTINGDSRRVLYEHPPYDRLPFAFEVTGARRRLLFSIAMDPAVYDGSHPICGDGAEFRLETRDQGGRIEPLYSRYIDPKNNPAERRWIPGVVDLSRYMGQRIEVLFTTTPGPAGNTCMDWAGWGDPHFEGTATALSAFQLSYDREIKVFEYPEILPRAALFSEVKLVPDEAAALKEMGSETLDVFRTAVVPSKGLTEADADSLRKFSGGTGERVQAARIVSYSSREVRIEAAPQRSSLLVLNDSDYPGWQVYVDGKRSHWITANYMFRGVLIDAGRHEVRFAYEPESLTQGAAISGAGLAALVGFVIWRKRINRDAVK